MRVRVSVWVRVRVRVRETFLVRTSGRMAHHNVDAFQDVLRTTYDVVVSSEFGTLQQIGLEVLNLVTRRAPLLGVAFLLNVR
jgi:hypothetical protein